ncbi:MAG TPA: CoA-acylating methylmalonate-semialdehyde dehydrogenase [Gemmatimonadetes bacterium]|nr:CoA-acylating methylmalonate-semialdehyde dehydrogenase [Gemmatimonadota bacterium]
MAVSTTAQSRPTDDVELPIPNFIGGEWIRSSASDALPVHDPGTGEPLGRVPLSTRDDVHAAVAAAKEAFPAWRATPAVDRVRVLFRLQALLHEHRDDLARDLSREHGKNVAECSGEIQRGIENVEHACCIPTLMMGDTLEDVARGIDCETVRQPLGVFAGITPYNFPVMIPMWFWPYAVATGNTFVLKPSEQDPLTHQRIVELAAQAGLPSGVLNIVHGDHSAADAILEHPDVSGISFVGSSAVARMVYAKAAQTGKRVQALGGAKNHMVVLPDADLDFASEAAISSVFGSAGQRCLANSVLVGVGEAYDRVKERVLDRATSLRVGYGLDEDTFMGPVISRRHRDRVVDLIDQGEREGASVALDGRGFQVDGYPEGHWVGPTVLEGVEPGTHVGQEEIFGPVLGLTRAESVEEAIALMHEIEYGNATSIFTQSGRAAREFRYHAGISMIGVNIGVAAPMACFPFGGSRGSFYGDLKAQGKDAVEFFTDKRVIISRW